MRVINGVLGSAFSSGATHMDASPSDSPKLDYSDLPPVLLAASSQTAMALAERTVRASGFRIGARLAIELASERIANQGSTAALWVELDRDCGGPMDELLSRVSRDVAGGRYAAIVSTTAALVDPLAARLEESRVELIVDADDAERAAALAIATSQRGLELGVADIAGDKNAERLRQLSEEVSRIASTLARLSTGPAAVPSALEPLPGGDAPPLSAETVRSVIHARRLRARYFSEELF